MDRGNHEKTIPVVKEKPCDIYSLKIEYIDVIEECGEGPGEIIRRPGQERFVMASYHNQDSILDFLLYFQQNYEHCTIKSLSLVKVVFTDEIHHGPEITVGKIEIPIGYDWLKPEQPEVAIKDIPGARSLRAWKSTTH